MAKEITGMIKLQAKGGQATPAPPIGPALGQHGVNIGQFVQQFNERTRELNGKIEAGIQSGSGEPNKKKVGKVTKAQIRKIAETKLADLNAFDLEHAGRIIEGTARSMGLVVED